ncbi:MAG: hypothetical protein LAN84_16255, partial [Acidobacteriia bacterium]|nr:hypothetical protein [Terriglobia bacterium]
YQGSFSKSLAPGLRLGYLAASPQLLPFLTRLKQAADLHSNQVSQWLVLQQLNDSEAVESLLGHGVGDAAQRVPRDPRTAIVLLSAAGKLFQQETARRYAGLERIILICGRYEGVDERVAEHLATEEVSVGDYVLSGGELPAAIILDAVTRLLPGALGNIASAVDESFSAAAGAAERARHVVPLQAEQAAGAGQVLLDYPHYTRPAEFRGWKAPEVLIGGNHAEVAKWRRAAALEKTRRNRPDLLRREASRSAEH